MPCRCSIVQSCVSWCHYHFWKWMQFYHLLKNYGLKPRSKEIKRQTQFLMKGFAILNTFDNHLANWELELILLLFAIFHFISSSSKKVDLASKQGSNPSPDRSLVTYSTTNHSSTNSLYIDPEIHTTPTRSEKWLDM